MKDPEGVFWLSRKKAESAPENCCNREREQKKNQRDNAQTGRNRVKSKKKDQLKQAQKKNIYRRGDYAPRKEKRTC